MRLEAFKAEDYYKIDRVEDTGLEYFMLKDNIPAALLQLEAAGSTRSLWCGDKLYAIFGVVEVRLGVGEVFFFPSKDWIKKKKSVCQYVKRDLDILTKLFMRIQMSCLKGDVFLRFSKFFGFKKEGDMPKYDLLGRTYTLLSITGGNP